MAQTRRKIALYVHPAHGFGPNYLLHALVEVWSERGIETEISDDPDKDIAADIAFLHVDLTVLPDTYRALLERYPVVVNGKRTSIAKRVVSDNLLSRDSGYRGLVIVKSDENVAGIQDDRARGWRVVWHPRVRRKLNNWLPLRLTGGVFATYYRIYESLDRVPAVVWRLDRLIVEKFLPERDGDLYCIRYAEFLGDHMVTDMLYSENPIVKAGRHIRKKDPEPATNLLPQLRTWQQRFALDYGKLDFVVVDGAPVLLDVSATVGAYADRDAEAKTVALLADGIEPFFACARRRGRYPPR